MDVHFITDLGDQAVILPVLLAVGLGLLLVGWWRGALAWCVIVPATLGIVLVAKLSTIACQGLLPAVGLQSPSGHTAAAAIVFGGVIALALGGRLVPAALGAVAVAAAVGFTRVALNVHTLADVVVGGAIGVLGAIALCLAAGPRPQLRPRWITVAAGTLAALVLFHGRHVHAEGMIGDFARTLWPFRLCFGWGG